MESLGFRKRRLSLPKHRLAEAAAAAIRGNNDDDDNGSNNGKNRIHIELKTLPVAEEDTQRAQEDDADQKAHTFRKRRLSLTRLQQDGESKRSFHSDNDNNNQNFTWDTPNGDNSDAEPSVKRQRLLSNATDLSCQSEAAASSPNGTLKDHTTPPTPPTSPARSRILHSAEMIAGPFAPPSPMHHNPVLHSQNPLPPSQSSALDQEEDPHHNHHHHLLEPLLTSRSLEFSPRRWLRSSSGGKKQRRRHSWKMRHHHEDEDKLPFPKEMVGTYSCHGIEPIYEEEEGEENGEQLLLGDNEEEVEDDIWGDKDEEEAKNDNDNNQTKGKETPENGKNATQEEKEDNAEEELDEVDLEPRPLPEGGVSVAAAAAADENTADNEKPTTTTTAISAKINQDRGGITYPYANSERCALFSVYDGHGAGGELVSQFALHEIQRRLEQHPQFGTDLERALRETFLAVDEALKHEPIIEPFFAGTTACVALMQHKTLTLANCGDSRAVLARRRDDGEYDALDLTVDQNPDSPEEMQRIVGSGGFVSPPPGPGLSSRVWLDSEMTQIGLAMARSLGDHAVANVGVIADPVVTTAKLTEKDDFLILASDGVWEFLESSEAVEIVGDHLGELGATKACQALIEAAASKWQEEEGAYRDDITAIVVRLPNLFGPNKDSNNKDNGDKGGE